MFLSELYHDPTTVGGLGGVDKFYKTVKNLKPDITKKNVQDFLTSQRAYTLHKPIRKPKVYRRVIVKGIGELYQADLVDFQKYSRQNRGFRYACFIIDCFSKRLWVFKLKTKGMVTVKTALAPFFIENSPKSLQCDQGLEFWNKIFQAMLKDLGIKLYHTNTNKKAQIVERVQRTIREKIERYFTHTKKHRWIDVIDEVVVSYNNTIHSTIKMRPIDVTYKDTPKILKRLYPKRVDKGVQFQVGDEVRAAKPRKLFQKRSRAMWRPETFTIVKAKNTNPITYKIQHAGVMEPQTFYSAELQRVS